jgi:hypothetical protein
VQQAAAVTTAAAYCTLVVEMLDVHSDWHAEFPAAGSAQPCTDPPALPDNHSADSALCTQPLPHHHAWCSYPHLPACFMPCLSTCTAMQSGRLIWSPCTSVWCMAAGVACARCAPTYQQQQQQHHTAAAAAPTGSCISTNIPVAWETSTGTAVICNTWQAELQESICSSHH